MKIQRKHNNEKTALSNLGNISRKSIRRHRGPKFTVANVEEFKKNKNREIIFSFKFFDRSHEAFNLGNVKKVCDNWFVELIDCLKEVSSRNWGQLINESKYDPHSHNFEKTNFRYELFDNEALKQLECVQFRLSKSYGRVHGFLIDNCFYIYWLDPHHNMNDSVGYEGVTKYSAMKSCFELLNEYNIILNQKNQKLHNDIKDMEKDQETILEDLIKAEEKIKELEEIIELHDNNL